MKINRNEILIESPKGAGEEAEFFLQANEPNTVTCHAHIHNAVELLYVKAGSYNVLLDGEEYEIREGDLILFCSNSIHYVTSQNSPKNEYYVIKIPPSFFLEFSRREMGAEYIMRFALGGKERKVLWKAEELRENEILLILNLLVGEYESQRYAAEIAIRLKIMELLLAILRENTYGPRLVNNRTVELIYSIMLYVRDNYYANIDEGELAKSVGMSYSYFSRSFKHISGMTFRKYLNMTRVHRAEQILCTSGESITEIAAKCGYNSTSYFINVYRSITGKTPYQTQRGNKSENGSKFSHFESDSFIPG